MKLLLITITFPLTIFAINNTNDDNNRKNPFNRLANEELQHINKFLSPQSLAALSQASRRHHSNTKQELYMMKKFIPLFNVTFQNFINTGSHQSFKELKFLETQNPKILKYFRKIDLRKINVNKLLLSQPNRDFLDNLFSQMSNLSTLAINTNIDSFYLDTMTKTLKDLTLNVYIDQSWNVNSPLPAVQKLTLYEMTKKLNSDDTFHNFYLAHSKPENIIDTSNNRQAFFPNLKTLELKNIYIPNISYNPFFQDASTQLDSALSSINLFIYHIESPTDSPKLRTINIEIKNNKRLIPTIKRAVETNIMRFKKSYPSIHRIRFTFKNDPTVIVEKDFYNFKPDQQSN